jgi:hypothetical protein
VPDNQYPPGNWYRDHGGQGGWSLIPSLPETCPCRAFLLVDPWRPPGRWHVSRPAWRSARLASSVGLERGPVSLRKVSSGGPCRYSINRSRISSRSLVSNWCACRSPCTVYQCKVVPPAGELSEIGRATRCPTRDEGRPMVQVVRRSSSWRECAGRHPNDYAYPSPEDCFLGSAAPCAGRPMILGPGSSDECRKFSQRPTAARIRFRTGSAAVSLAGQEPRYASAHWGIGTRR